jgi:aryl-alcohol dehydrogenase-like predicted oxidoreductase
MQKTRLGKTGLQVTRTAFGALPIQRLNEEDAVNLLRKAYEAGINFFDTARGYTDSEEKIGHALSDVRHNIIIATKSGATDRKTIRKDLETSLSKLKTDYIDLFQLHNPACMPDPDDMDGAYQALADAKREGLVRHIGMTNHRLDLAMKAVASGLFETIQFPLSSLSSGQDLSLVAACDMQDVGFIAMKAMSGGLITNAASSFAFDNMEMSCRSGACSAYPNWKNSLRWSRIRRSWIGRCFPSLTRTGSSWPAPSAGAADIACPVRPAYRFHWQQECPSYCVARHIRASLPRIGRNRWTGLKAASIAVNASGSVRTVLIRRRF